jgi:hypothetical protein
MLLAVFAAPVHADTRRSLIPAPPLSPYLNQLRGVNPAVNYYFGKAAQSERHPVHLGRPTPTFTDDRVPREITQPWNPESTGHPVQFMNAGPYFHLSFGAQKADNARTSRSR